MNESGCALAIKLQFIYLFKKIKSLLPLCPSPFTSLYYFD